MYRLIIARLSLEWRPPARTATKASLGSTIVSREHLFYDRAVSIARISNAV